MKVVLFSDLHAHPFKSYATLLPNGMNSRLADAVSCLSQIYEHSVAVGADLVLFGGDMFHVRKTIAVQAFNAVFEQMAKFHLAKIPVLMIHGNHDQADRAGEQFSIYAFKSLVDVVDKPGWVVPVDGIAVHAIPYLEGKDAVHDIISVPCPDPKMHMIQLSHLGVQNAVVGADFVLPSPHDPSILDLKPSHYDAVFLGHYHKYQRLADNAWYIGAPLHHNWGDRHDYRRGFLIYDTETKAHDFVPLKAPRFVEYTDPDDIRQQDVKDCFVRLVSKTPWSEDQRESFRQLIGARTLEVVPPRDVVRNVVTQRLQVDPSMSTAALIEKYVESGLGNADGLDNGYLLQLGYEILEEVETSS